MNVAAAGSRLLLVSPRIEDHAAMHLIFRYSPWEIHGAFSAEDGLRFLRRDSPVSVVICEEVLPDGNWKVVMGETGEPRVRPSFIVCSRIADERLWAEVLNLGAFDLLLSSPFETEEVTRATESAWLAWNRGRGQTVVPRIGPGSAWTGGSTRERHRAAVNG